MPRRNQMLQWTLAERAIYDAMQRVESMDADVRLTDAVILLGRAQARVADYVDGVTPAISQAPSRELAERLAKVLAICEEITPPEAEAKRYGAKLTVAELRIVVEALKGISVGVATQPDLSAIVNVLDDHGIFTDSEGLPDCSCGRWVADERTPTWNHHMADVLAGAGSVVSPP